jgi:hypothetical protein
MTMAIEHRSMDEVPNECTNDNKDLFSPNETLNFTAVK